MPVIIFLCQLCYVFLLGMQSRNVNDGQYVAAAGTSLALGVLGLTAISQVVNTASTACFLAYVAAGPIGICLAMWSHKRIYKREER